MKKIILPLLAGLMFVGCTREDINENSHSAYEVIPSTLITFAQKALSDNVTTPNVNNNNFRLTMQYWTETTYVQESNYDFASRSVSDQVYSDNYVNVLNNLVKAKGLINAYIPTPTEAPTWEAVKTNQLSIIDIMIVYTYQNLVDTFGDIPYTEANQLATTVTPKYDDAASIYGDLISRLETDISSLQVVPTLTPTTSSALGTADLYYSGDVTKWKKFGSSVLLKLGIALADVNPSLAQTTVNNAVSYGVITTAADNAKLVYLSSSPNYSPIYANVVASDRNDYVGGKPFIDYLTATGDTRITKYFKTVPGVGGYRGQGIGTPAAFDEFSAPGQFAYTATTPGILLNNTEVFLYLAEAAARWNIGSADANYNSAVTSSFVEWGLSASDATAYLTAHPYDPSNWKKSIGEQAWVSMYNQPLTSWNFWRRLDFPQLTAASNATPSAEGKIPVRLVYSPREASTNGANVAAAAAAIGGDKMTTKLFWDKF